jgi:hypothetical protein
MILIGTLPDVSVGFNGKIGPCLGFIEIALSVPFRRKAFSEPVSLSVIPGLTGNPEGVPSDGFPLSRE